MYVYMNTHMHVQTLAHTYPHTYTLKNTHTHTNTRMHTFVHTHTNTLKLTGYPYMSVETEKCRVCVTFSFIRVPWLIHVHPCKTCSVCRDGNVVYIFAYDYIRTNVVCLCRCMCACVCCIRCCVCCALMPRTPWRKVLLRQRLSRRTKRTSRKRASKKTSSMTTTVIKVAEIKGQQCRVNCQEFVGDYNHYAACRIQTKMWVQLWCWWWLLHCTVDLSMTSCLDVRGVLDC